VKCLVQHARQVLDPLHEIIVLGAGPSDADGVAFLEGVVADQMSRHLAGDDDDWNGIAERVGEPGDRIGGAGTRGHQHAADLAGRARIALGRVHGTLLVAHQNMPDPILRLEQRVIDRQHRAARIAEHHLNPLLLEGFEDDGGPQHGLIVGPGIGHGTLELF
jgi:hypothetical protein